MTLDEYQRRLQAKQIDDLHRLLAASTDSLDQRVLATDPKFADPVQTRQHMASPVDSATSPEPAEFDEQRFQQALATGREMVVPDAALPQPLTGVQPRSDAQQQADEFTDFYRGLPWNIRVGINQEGGLPTLVNQFMQQRQSAAQKQMEMALAQRKGQMDNAFKVFLDHNTPWSARAKALSQMGDPYAMSLARVGSEQIASNFAMAHPYLDDEFKQQWEKDPTSIPPAVVEAHLKQAMQRAEKDQQFQLENKRTEDIRQRVLNNKPVTLEEAKHLQKVMKEQEELPLQLEQLRTQIAKQKQDMQIAGTKPSEAYSTRGPGGEIITGIYDPRTGQTTERTGMPLQRVQTQDITAATKTKNAEILDNAENVMGLIRQYRSVLKPENVGVIGDLRAVVFGAGQQSDAFAQLLKGQATSVVDQLGQFGSTVNVSNFFDPNLSKGQLLGNILAYQLAFMNSPDGRVSNDDFKIAKGSFGLDKLLTGAGEIHAKLDSLEEVVIRRSGIARRRLSQETQQKPKYNTIEEYKKARGIK